MKRINLELILLAAIGGGYWAITRSAALAAVESGYWSVARSSAAAPVLTSLTGSGTIEAETVVVTAELGGRIVELKVDEGDEVTAGQVLVELDKAGLLAQQAQLEAALATAKANLALVRAPARTEDITAARAQLTQAEVAWDGARLTWQRAGALVNNPNELQARINQAQARVTEAESNLELAQVNLKRMDIQAEAAGRNQSDHAALVQNEVAQYQLQAARTGIELAEMALAGTKRQVEHLVRLRERPWPLIAQANVAAAVTQQAEAAIFAAEANLVAVKAGPTPEDIAIAQAQVLEAEATLAAVDVQLAKQTLIAPRDGLVSQKLVESGELATPGAVLLKLDDIETVELTVYIPETQIGQVKIGQKAQVYVDAYAGESLAGAVSFMAHEAEFTPRNVQTQQERVNLVFAVKIKLDNADHRLKPGMPADAEILLTSQPSVEKAPSPTALPRITAASTATPALAKAKATPTATPTLTPTTTKASPSVQAEIITWELNVRRGPGMGYPVITTLAKGDTVPVIDVDPNTGWLQVQLPDGEKTGWISGSPTYVSVN
jgi:multidrug resistance efflux pump